VKIGVIADGQAEVAALKELFRRFNIEKVTICDPLYADMQPHSTPKQILKAAEGRLAILNGRGCNKIVVLIDRETRQDCPGNMAQSIASAFHANGHQHVNVVVKDRAFENWLVADMVSLQATAARKYDIRQGLIDRIRNSGADNMSAINLLDNCVRGGYSKRRDAIEICKVVDPIEVARNSRSFRRLMRVMGDQRYLDQSKLRDNAVKSN